ncbi:MAG: phosphatase PAP2 family protein [Rhizobiaceae bacterium]|nr:phosphatase PAP2 family protein [Rhizobiaceae bacterium]MCZ8352557.1 phosphatase PAP2 family protein [Rhizobium sp.]
MAESLEKGRAGKSGLARKGMWKQAPNTVVFCVLGISVLATAPDNRRLGDMLQIGIPVAALACASVQGGAKAFLGRYLFLEIGIKTPKLTLGAHPLNRRPDGGLQGFPSGHTAAATFGAVHLVVHCASLHPLAKGALVLAASFTGLSRVEAGRHTAWQVMAGTLWGWVSALICFGELRAKSRDLWRKVGLQTGFMSRNSARPDRDQRDNV